MKLKDEYKPHSDLLKQGYLFDPEEHLFFVEDNQDFIRPNGYEDWETKIIDTESYLNARLLEMGATEKDNEVALLGGIKMDKNEFFKHQIFQTNKRGDIGILQFSLDRVPYTYIETKPVKREQYHEQIRLAPWNEKIFAGKYDFSKAKNIPFFPKNLIENYEADSCPSDMLIITEGQFKAFKAGMEGLPVVGLTSISHYRNKETGTIHTDIIKYIKKCNIKRVVILWDGDCRDISTKAIQDKEDLSKRPRNFYNFATKIREMIQEFVSTKKTKIFYATLKSQEIDEGKSKGIDDLLINHPKEVERIKADFEQIGDMPSRYIEWFDISNETGKKKLYKWFNLTSATSFYNAHREKIGKNKFIFQGNTYEIKDGSPIMTISADLRQYKRIGTDYYRVVKEPVTLKKTGEIVTEEALVPWTASAIQLDHGKHVLPHIEKFLGFTNQANHTEYQQVIEAHWNLYQNLEHKVMQGKFEHIEILLKHLFQEQYEMALDYISVLYHKPYRKLPVVCLVSKEQKTGKSTFIYLLKLIFKQNMVSISSNDLIGDFNSHWITKLVVASEETLLEKKEAYEKIKDISTKKSYLRNEKNKVAKEIPCMVHFVFCSNHEDSFIKIDNTDSRLWIIKVNTIEKKIKGFDQKIADEIPAFIDFIQNREISTPDTGERMYFEPDSLKTDAFYNVVKHSEPSVIKEIREHLGILFAQTGVSEIKMSAKDIKTEFGIRQKLNYINREIKTYLKPEMKLGKDGKPSVSTYAYLLPEPNKTNEFISRKSKGKYFIFKAEDFND